MSFVFKWPQFSDDFDHDARQMLEAALNKGKKPPIIADRIEVVELEMGTQPPELEIRDIGDLTLDQFRGIFRLTYSGDAHIVLRTKVQANPLNHKRPDIHMLGGSCGMLAAHQSLVVPMLLRLSRFRLNAYVVLVVSKQKGITLVFKTDPLQNVDVNSTFDSIAVIQKFIQREIEGQLREMFREDLPGIIHRLSQRWVTGKTKIEAPYLSKQREQSLHSTPERPEVMSSPDMSSASFQRPPSTVGLHPFLRRQSFSSLPPLQRGQSPFGFRSTVSISSAPEPSAVTSLHDIPATSYDAPATFPDIENFDPTYGLRPDDLPAKSGYSGFGRLFGAPRGLGDLAEESLQDGTEWDEADSFDVVDWEDAVQMSAEHSEVPEDTTEYESLPAVGGGTITRPRVLHSQSMVRPPAEATSSASSSLVDGPREQVKSLIGTSRSDTLQNPTWPERQTQLPDARRQMSLPWIPQVHPVSASTRLGRSASFASTPTPSLVHADKLMHRSLSSEGSFLMSLSGGTKSSPSQASSIRARAPSTPSPLAESSQGSLRSPKGLHQLRRGSDSTSNPLRQPEDVTYGSPPNFRTVMDADGNIVLRPGINNTVSQLSTLSYSNHTLSPYTRSLEHFTVRSVPHRAPNPAPASDRQPPKAKRKRIYRLGGHKPPDPPVGIAEGTLPPSPAPPSEFEVSDVDHYFSIPPPPDLQRRASYQAL